MSPRVGIIATGSANVASVRAGLLRCGLQPEIVATTKEAISFDALVLPGVGAFGAAMVRLRETGFTEFIPRHLEAGKPLLAICLGLQLLASGSEESPGIPGLGVLKGTARRLTGAARVPQLGWNRISPPDRGPVREGYAWFANSYALWDACPDWDVATVEYGSRWIAALSRGPQLACQFHPELSGHWGAALLRQWRASW